MQRKIIPFLNDSNKEKEKEMFTKKEKELYTL